MKHNLDYLVHGIIIGHFMVGVKPQSRDRIARHLGRNPFDIECAIQLLLEENKISRSGLGYIPRQEKPGLVEVFPVNYSGPADLIMAMTA